MFSKFMQECSRSCDSLLCFSFERDPEMQQYQYSMEVLVLVVVQEKSNPKILRN
jgi:hypothetical protein